MASATEVSPAAHFAAPTVGATHWKNNTEKEVKVNASLVDKNYKNIDVGQRIDPLPHMREVYGELSNLNAIDYMREVRIVANRLREALLTVNENIKTTIRTRYNMERELENLRKDLAVNEQSIKVRRTRPKRERVADGVDHILQAERKQLFGLKETAERHLKTLKEHLQVFCFYLNLPFSFIFFRSLLILVKDFQLF